MQYKSLELSTVTTLHKGRVEKATRRNEHAAQVQNTREATYRAATFEDDFTSLTIF